MGTEPLSLGEQLEQRRRERMYERQKRWPESLQERFFDTRHFLRREADGVLYLMYHDFDLRVLEQGRDWAEISYGLDWAEAIREDRVIEDWKKQERAAIRRHRRQQEPWWKQPLYWLGILR